MTVYDKDPNDRLDWAWDWSDWLPEGDAVTASTWTAESGITVDDDSFDADTTIVWLVGGTAGESYTVTNHIVTADGREKDRSLTIRVKQQ
jgi:hypothetical protein